MPEPAVNPVDESANGAASSASSSPAHSNEVNELRRLLVGAELEQLARLESRVAQPASRTADMAEVLPDAIRGAKGKALRDALEPTIEKAFSNSVRKNPKEVADAIYPVMGPAIRSSIAAAIRDFAEALNQIVEKSASFRAIRWRIESIVSGKPFNEILLARSLLYSVEQVFLIHRKSGLLLVHVAAKGSVLKDADMISGMLTAIQDFLSDSFAEGGQELETVDTGRFKLWLTYHPKVLLVAAVSGTAPIELRKVFRKALDGVEENLQGPINNFKQDDLSVFEPARPFLESCLLGQSGPAQRKKATLWPYLAGLAVILLAFYGWHLYTELRWNRFFDSLKGQPGIVVTGVEKTGSLFHRQWLVSGLKDPLASDPTPLARAQNLNPAEVRYAWQPYISLNTPFAAQRDLDAVLERIRNQIIRFDTNSSKLVIANSQRIDDLNLAIHDLLRLHPNSKVVLNGHADDVGNPQLNDKLSLARANQVLDALVAQGLPAASLQPVGLGNTKPLRAGTSDWDRGANRSVSFEVTLQ
jgi:OOP family OmpA-OmpF porin